MIARIGLTGHQELPEQAIGPIKREFTEEIRPIESGVIISNLAAGTDQILARLALSHNFQLEAVIPCEQYETTFNEADLDTYRTLLQLATAVTTLEYPEPCERAFMAAGKLVVDRCDLLMAIWDGVPSRGWGGTADVVEYARQIGRPTKIIWPEGVRRA
jgi:hypothetical protein